MGDGDTGQFADLLQPLRSSGWTAAIVEHADHLELALRHPLQDVDVNAASPEELRRMLHQLFAPDSAFMRALREAPEGRTADLAVIGDIIRACRPFSPSARLPSTVLGVMADRGFIHDTTYAWFREHAQALVSGPG